MFRVLLFVFVVASTRADSCPYAVDPVCGSDGELYFNECTLKDWNKDKDVHAVAWSECQVDCDIARPCTMEYSPHCGSDGVIYANRCIFLWANCGLPAPLVIEPLVNCIDKQCPNNCETDDVDCQANVTKCRQPWENYIVIPED